MRTQIIDKTVVVSSIEGNVQIVLADGSSRPLQRARSSNREPSLILQMTPNWYWLPMTILLLQLLQMLPLMTHQPWSTSSP